MQSLKKKGLKSKFGKFAISTEKAKKVNGGVSAVCVDKTGYEYIIASNDASGLQALVDRDGGDCGDIIA